MTRRTDATDSPGTTCSTREDGFTLIDILFVVAIIGTLASLAIPGLARARASTTAASAIASLRVINSGQISYAITCGNGFYAPNLTTLGRAPAGSLQAFVPPDLGSANTVRKSTYLIQLSATPLPQAPPSCNGLGGGQGSVAYKAGADSTDPVLNRFFATNATGVIYEATVPLFAVIPEADPPPVGNPIK
jgi:type II secretory pathway pseudopilin PulG